MPSDPGYSQFVFLFVVLALQVLDESMCVIREDICDWLQRYVFSEANVSPLDDARDLLERLKSGVWLARLAHKLHFKVSSFKFCFFSLKKNIK